MRLSPMNGRRFVSSRAEHCRKLAEECRQLVKTLPAADRRAIVLDMALEWERLAEQQDRATCFEEE
jgi:hypothetical protein